MLHGCRPPLQHFHLYTLIPTLADPERTTGQCYGVRDYAARAAIRRRYRASLRSLRVGQISALVPADCIRHIPVRQRDGLAVHADDAVH